MVIASEIDMAPYALKIPRNRAKIRILEELEISTMYERQFQTTSNHQRFRYTLMWQKVVKYVNHLLGNFDGFTAVSDPELALIMGILKNEAPSIIGQVIPNGINITDYQGDFGSPIPDTIIFTGALTYYANFDAIKYFLNEIWPLVLEKRPKVKFSITGSVKGVSINRLPNTKNIIFTGYLPDIRPAIAQSWVNIVPLRIGGGTRLKILESLALNTPVITTSKGAEGLQLCPDQDILIADNPQKFTNKITGLLENPMLRHQISKQGNRSVSRFNWDRNGDLLNEFIDNVSTTNQ
jgi:glycosyltransferase involved in cell wall biosynthesis